MLSGVRLLGPGLQASLLPLLLLVFALAFSSGSSNPPARMGDGPFDGPHCHSGEDLVPPAQSKGAHTHNDFHSGRIPKAEWKAFSEKFGHYLADNNVRVELREKGQATEHRIVSFPSNWKPEDQEVWHNHGDDDTAWWTPDPDGADNCNFTPEFSQSSYSFSVEENAAEGTPVGGMVQAHDGDGDHPTHTLQGTDKRFFTIDSVTGQIEIKVPLDYEAKSNYSVTVRATDPGGLHAEVPR